MGIFSKVFKRDDAKIQRDFQNNIVATGVHGSLLPDNESEIAQKRELGSDLLYIEDEDLRMLIYLFMMEDVMQIKTNENGDIVYLIDPVTGTYFLGSDGQPVPQYVKAQRVKYHWAGIYSLCSNIASLDIVLPQDIPLYRIDIDEVTDDTIDKLTEEEVNLGAISFIVALRSILYRMLGNSLNGNKLKIMRELRISKELGLKVNQKEKKAVM